MPRKIQRLDIPEMKWERINMDFIIGLPSILSGFDSILVMVDFLTKVSHLIRVRTNYTSVDIAKVFVRKI